MKITEYRNGKTICRDMTPEEELEYISNQPQEVEQDKKADNQTALQSFFEGLSSSETTSIAKIRALAKKFIEDTEIDTAINAQCQAEPEVTADEQGAE